MTSRIFWLSWTLWALVTLSLQGQIAPPEVEFTRGDANHDGVVSQSDASYIFGWLTDPAAYLTCDPSSDGASLGCQDACDADDDGEITIRDYWYVLAYQYLAGPPPPAPWPGCGGDATPDSLHCYRYDQPCQ